MGAERHGFRRTAASGVERRRAAPDGQTAQRPHIKKSGGSPCESAPQQNALLGIPRQGVFIGSDDGFLPLG